MWHVLSSFNLIVWEYHGPRLNCFHKICIITDNSSQWYLPDFLQLFNCKTTRPTRVLIPEPAKLNNLAKWLYKMALQNGSSKWLYKMALQNGSTKWLYKMALQNGSSKWLYKMALQNVSTKWLNKMAPQESKSFKYNQIISSPRSESKSFSFDWTVK